MHDDTDVVLPVMSDDVVAPAVWVERAPDIDWCPASLRPLLDDTFVVRSAREPGMVQHRAAPWHVLGASVRGRSHAHRGEHRDDAIALLAADDVLLLAVADGAGSSALGRIGAAVTAQLVVTRTAERFAAATDGGITERLGTAMAHAVHDAALRLHALAAAADVLPSALRTTLIVVAIAGDMMLVSQVGDGAVLVQRRDGTVQRVGAMRETAWAGEVTCFVPDACAMTQAAALRQLDARHVTLVALMTDGIDDPFHPLEQSGATLVQQWREGTTDPIGTAKQPATTPVLGDARALQQWMTFEQRGEVDDRSLLLAWRDGAQA